MKKIGMIGILTAVFTALLPFFTIGNLFYGDVNAKYFLLIFFVDAIALIAAYAFYRDRHDFSIKNRFLLGGLGLVLLTQYVSALLGVFPERSFWSDIFWSSGAIFFTHLLIGMVLLAEFLKEESWSLIRKAIAVSAGFFGFLTLLGVQGLGATGKFLWIPLGEESLTIGNETYAGAYLLIAFIVTLIELSRTKRKSIERVILLASTIFIVLSPLLTNTALFLGHVANVNLLASPTQVLGSARSSSAALIALLVFFFGYLSIRRFVPREQVKIAQITWSGTILAGLVTGVVLLFVPGSAVQNAYIESASAARPIVWEAGYQAFLDRPIFGWGPENFNHAFGAHFDNRLFQESNLAEIWFERAHNVFLDTFVTVGVVGTTAFVVLIFAYLYAVWRAKKGGRISDVEAVLLYALIPAHLLQMQTGFDTVATYTLLGLVGAYVLWLEKTSGEVRVPISIHKIASIILVLLALGSLKVTLFDEYVRQAALLETLTSKSAVDQKMAIATSLTRVSSFESLRMSSSSFIKGSLAALAEAPTPQKVKLILEFTSIYEQHFKTYLLAQPNDYRARMNYAYLLLIQTALGEDRITDTKAMLNGSYALSPANPITYILDSVAELYSGDLVEADRLMQEAVALNPDIEFTQEAAAYLEKQKREFPNISVLKITNL